MQYTPSSTAQSTLYLNKSLLTIFPLRAVEYTAISVQKLTRTKAFPHIFLIFLVLKFIPNPKC